MHDRNMGSNPNSLANLDKGRELRKKGAIRSTFSLKPETVATLKRLPNMSFAIDTIIDYVRQKGLYQAIFLDGTNDRSCNTSLNTKDMNDRKIEAEVSSHDMNDRLQALELELAAVRSQISAVNSKLEQESIEHANSKRYIARLEREKTDDDKANQSAIELLRALIAKPSNQGRVKKDELVRILGFLGG